MVSRIDKEERLERLDIPWKKIPHSNADLFLINKRYHKIFEEDRAE